MKYSRITLIVISLFLSLLLSVLCIFSTVLWICLNFSDGGTARPLPESQIQLRLDTVKTAQKWLGTAEGSQEHLHILQIYNSYEPLARGYEVKISDNWCATFGSCVAIEQGITEIVPTECGCERQIDLWKNLDRWEEQDTYIPLPGDYIYYNWDQSMIPGDNTGWADHVGIVVGTLGPAIKVIEGNRDDSVDYRVIFCWDHRIRGYGLPDYSAIA